MYDIQLTRLPIQAIAPLSTELMSHFFVSVTELFVVVNMNTVTLLLFFCLLQPGLKISRFPWSMGTHEMCWEPK